MKRYILYLVIFLIGAVAGMWLHWQRNPYREVTVIQRDTVVRVDTVREYCPVEIRKEVTDTMLIVLKDTVRVKDTLYISLPRERKIYASEDYYAEVSGYRPSLDYLEVYRKTEVVTERLSPVRKKNTLSIGLEADYINALSVPFYIEYERMIHSNVGVYGQIIYGLPEMQLGVGIGIKAQIEW